MTKPAHEVAADAIDMLDQITVEHLQPFTVAGHEALCPLDASVPAVIAALRAVINECSSVSSRADNHPVALRLADRLISVASEHLEKAEG